jgi:hypothetical protein
MGARRLARRAFASGAICAVAAAIAPAASWAGRPARLAGERAWATTSIPRTTLEIAGKGFRIGALSEDGRVAVLGDARTVDLFRVSSESSWDSISKPTARLRLPASALANLSATAISSDGTTVLVAAGAVGGSRAAVFVFHVASPGAWPSSVTPTATLTNAADPTGFGSGVALSSAGTTALVGASDGADVFHVAGPDSWRSSSNPTATLAAAPADAQAGGLGIAVALSADGTTALIGTTSEDTFAGAAYIYRAPAVDAWVSSATPDAVLVDGFVGPFGDGFGGAVSLSPDGTTALVGAADLAFGPSGAAYVFQVPTPYGWASSAQPEAAIERPSSPYGSGDDSPRSGDVPGWSVALSDEGTALVGEPSLLGGLGAADVFHVTGTDQSWGSGNVSSAKLSNAAGPPRDLFGAAVGISGDGTTALVSSARASFVYTQAGSWGATYCYVPYVRGKTLPGARRAIGSTHCRLGKVTRVSASRARSDRVISQRPEPGDRLPDGARVALRLATGGARQ